MKWTFLVIGLLLLANLVMAEEVPAAEEEAGAIGPEDGVLHGLDRVADNIAIFLSRIGGEENHANMVRKVVAERRAEHLRLLRLKQDGEITGQEFAKLVVGIEKNINKKEQQLQEAEQSVQEKKMAQSQKEVEWNSNKPTDAGSKGKGKS